MRRSIIIVAAVAALTAPSMAQTTGIPGFNDYTINALGSGSTSCTSLVVLTPSVMTFQVTAAPFTPVTIYVSLAPCTPASITGPTCQGTTLDLATTPLPLALTSGLTNAAGVYTFALPLPPVSPPVTVATQCVLFCVPSFLPLFTQAYDVTLT